MNAHLATLLLMPFIALSAAAAPQPQTKPNIIIILADDLGAGDMSCAGATKVKTPNIDRLAAEGVRFTQGYAPSATCTPSRYSMLTGEYAWRQKAKVNTILDGDAALCIEPGRFTLPALLRQAGYHTGVVGKWHLGLGDGQTRVDFNGEVKPGPLEIGFDYSHIIPATVDRVPSVWIENHQVRNLDPADPIQVSYITNLSDEPTGLQRPDLLKQGADKQHSCHLFQRQWTDPLRWLPRSFCRGPEWTQPHRWFAGMEISYLRRRLPRAIHRALAGSNQTAGE